MTIGITFLRFLRRVWSAMRQTPNFTSHLRASIHNCVKKIEFESSNFRFPPYLLTQFSKLIIHAMIFCISSKAFSTDEHFLIFANSFGTRIGSFSSFWRSQTILRISCTTNYNQMLISKSQTLLRTANSSRTMFTNCSLFANSARTIDFDGSEWLCGPQTRPEHRKKTWD